jgi:hypothetical protein
MSDTPEVAEVVRAPAPIISWGVVPSSEGQQVAIQIQTPAHTTQVVVPPDVARQAGEGLLNAAREAGSGLVTATLVPK